MKKCSKCGRRRARKSFYKEKSVKDGLRSICVNCSRIYYKKYRTAYASKIAFRRRVTDARYLAKKQNAVGDFTVSQWLEKCRFFGWRCYLCGKSLTAVTATVEHRKPMSKGGTNYISNVAPACISCNSIKNNATERTARARIAKRRGRNEQYI